MSLAFASGCLIRPVAPQDLARVMHPVGKNASTVRFVAVGDFGEGNEAQYAVANAIHTTCLKLGCDFALGLGDLILPNGIHSITDDALRTKFELPYAPLGNFDFWLIMGNHDWRNENWKGAQAGIDYTLKSPRWRLPDLNYAVPGLPDWVTIYGIDTNFLRSTLFKGAYKKYLGLKLSKELCSKPGWRLLFGHFPALSSGADYRDDPAWSRRQKTIRRLAERCGVDAYFSGHTHHQEHLDLGTFHQIVQGAGGQRLSPILDDTPEQRFARVVHGFAWVEVTRELMHIRFFDQTATQIYETDIAARR